MAESDACLDDIVAAAKQIAVYVEGVTRDEFLVDRMRQDAVVRQIEVMGEAAAHVEPEVKAAHPEVPWKEMAQLRNFYIHVYRRINYRKVWQTCQNTVPRVLRLVTALLPPDDEEP